MELPAETRKFIEQHSIDRVELEKILSTPLSRMPSASVYFDTETYKSCGVLRVVISDANHSLEPLLFGTLDNLEKLNFELWSDSAAHWQDEMTDLSQRGTFLKRVILLPAIIEAVQRYSNASGKLLDLGCGDGVLFQEFINMSIDAWGLDFSPAFVSSLQRQYPVLKDKILVGDATKLEFENYFDTIVASALLLGIPDVEAALVSIYRALVQGGVVIIADVNSACHRSLGYFEGNTLIQVHDVNNVFRIEKSIGGGKTKAIHNHHPPGLYRSYLEKMGMVCREDRELCVTSDSLKQVKLSNSELSRLVSSLTRDMIYPPFRILVMAKD